MTSFVTLLAVAAIVVGAPTPGRAADKSDVADAVMKGDKAALRRLLQQKADVNAPQLDGATALHWAVYRDDLEAADLLIAGGAKVDAANRDAFTPLAMASLYGNVPMIERLLTAGADAKQRLANGETMVMLAARNGNPLAIRMLVAAGADVNAKENLRGTTALMWAAEQRHSVAVKMLLEVGADYSARSGPAGLPRNYMAPRVNTANVRDAARRHAAAAAAGRTYDEQLEFEVAQGSKVSLGIRPRPTPVEGTAAPAPAAPVAVAPVEPTDDNVDVIVAGLVGSGGGGLTPLVFAAREGDLASARRCSTPAPTSTRPPSTAGRRC